MLEGGGGPTGIAVLLRLHRAPPSPRGPQCAQSPRWGGRLETVIPVWKLSSLSSNTHRYGWPPPGLYYLSVRRDFRPGLSSASRGSGVTKATAFVSFQGGTPSRLCSVHGPVWPLTLFKGNPLSGLHVYAGGLNWCLGHFTDSVTLATFVGL